MTSALRCLGPVLFFAAGIVHGAAQPAPAPGQFSTRPAADNDTTLRALSPEEIPPNLNFYAVDPLYRPGVALGWAVERIEEKPDRGLTALVTADGGIYLGWRLLKSDPADTAFHVYRRAAGEAASVRLTAVPLTRATDFSDTAAPRDRDLVYTVRAVVGDRELADSPTVTVAAGSAPQNYRALKLRPDVTSIALAAIGDLDGDGVYDFVVKHPGGGKDPGRIAVNRDTYKFDGYNGRTGAFMWRIDLGWNVDMGIWWTPLVVRDLDGDNKAEVVLRTKPYAATLDAALPGARTGNVLEGPEWVSVFDGETGREVDKADWIELQSVQHWGDNTGNRASRHLLGTAYLDGKTPAILVARGTYGVMKVDAWTFENKKLRKLWRWTNERAPFLYHGQGQHSLKVGDIDGDGRDEIINGSLAIDPDGRTRWSSGLGHGDRFYLTDIDPARPGLEIAYVIEEAHAQLGLHVRSARHGDLHWGAREPNLDNAIDQCAVGDIDPRFRGMEVWANKGLKQLFYTARGEPIPGPVPPTSELVWWDADRLREQLYTAPRSADGDGGDRFARAVGKWRDGAHAPLTTGLRGTVQHVADILGDWREEIVTFADGELRIYSTTIPANDRRVCLMQDPIYRHDVTHRSMGYAHVPQLSYYLGEN